MDKFGYIGMTHLGIVSLLATSNVGKNVLGFDFDNSLISDLKIGKFPIIEPKLQEIYEKNKDKIHFSSDISELNKCNVIYFAYDVPTDEKGKSDNEFINKKIKSILKYLNKKAYLIILCQVKPGFTSKVKWPEKQKFYQVETLVFGDAIERACKPERIIVGSNNKQKLPKKIQAYLNLYNCPIILMNYQSAELTKISINIFLVSSITVSNSLSEICEKINGSWNDIVPALRQDKRIGKYSYLKPGLGIAGGNLERDLENIVELSNEYDTHSQIINSFKSNSNYNSLWVQRKVIEISKKVKIKKIAIWGVTYKENTHSLKNSPAIKNIRKLSQYKVNIYDPVIDLEQIDIHAEKFNDKMTCLKDCNLFIIFVPWKFFSKISCKQIEKFYKGKFIIDPYKSLQKSVKKKFNIITLGESG